MDQPFQSVQPKKPIIIYIIIAVIAGLLGMLAGYYFLGIGLEKVGIQSSCQSALKEVFNNTSLINNLYGKIIGISSDKKSLAVEVAGVYGVNLPKNYQEKKVLIDENTKIVLMTKKTAEDFEKELAELKIKGNTIPPSPYAEKEIKIDDLITGDQISFNFMPAENSDVLSSQFIAAQINVYR